MRQRNEDLSVKIFHEQRGQVGDGLGLCRRQEGMDIQQRLGILGKGSRIGELYLRCVERKNRITDGSRSTDLSP